MNKSTRTYQADESCVFRLTRDEWGELSNFWAGPEPILVNSLAFKTSEAFFQALKYPYDPAYQEQIAQAPTPALAKKLAWRRAPPRDWDKRRADAMRLVLRIKVATCEQTLRKILSKTGNRPIVELSTRDMYWGARRSGENELIGHNILGRLWMELRQEARTEQQVPDYRKWTNGFYVESKQVRIG